MNLIEIISIILNLLLGTGITIQFLTIRSIRKEAAAKADSAKSQAGKEKIELVDNTVTTMVEAVNKLLEQNQKLIKNHAVSVEENQQLKQEISDLEQKFSVLEKKMNRMIQTNLKVVKALENLGIDEEIIKPLREQ